MVVRIFRSTPKLEHIKEYEKVLTRDAVLSLQRAKGCKGVKILKSLGVVREVIIVSFWDSLESIKAYCGQSWHSPVLVGDEQDMIEGEPDVRHYHEILSSDF
jgi:heme-degrading monooxygenase HmoA